MYNYTPYFNYFDFVALKNSTRKTRSCSQRREFNPLNRSSPLATDIDLIIVCVLKLIYC